MAMSFDTTDTKLSGFQPVFDTETEGVQGNLVADEGPAVGGNSSFTTYNYTPGSGASSSVTSDVLGRNYNYNQLLNQIQTIRNNLGSNASIGQVVAALQANGALNQFVMEKLGFFNGGTYLNGIFDAAGMGASELGAEAFFNMVESAIQENASGDNIVRLDDFSGNIDVSNIPENAQNVTIQLGDGAEVVFTGHRAGTSARIFASTFNDSPLFRESFLNHLLEGTAPDSDGIRRYQAITAEANNAGGYMMPGSNAHFQWLPPEGTPLPGRFIQTFIHEFAHTLSPDVATEQDLASGVQGAPGEICAGCGEVHDREHVAFQSAVINELQDNPSGYYSSTGYDYNADSDDYSNDISLLNIFRDDQNVQNSVRQADIQASNAAGVRLTAVPNDPEGRNFGELYDEIKALVFQGQHAEAAALLALIPADMVIEHTSYNPQAILQQGSSGARTQAYNARELILQELLLEADSTDWFSTNSVHTDTEEDDIAQKAELGVFFNLIAMSDESYIDTIEAARAYLYMDFEREGIAFDADAARFDPTPVLHTELELTQYQEDVLASLGITADNPVEVILMPDNSIWVSGMTITPEQPEAGTSINDSLFMGVLGNFDETGTITPVEEVSDGINTQSVVQGAMEESILSSLKSTIASSATFGSTTIADITAEDYDVQIVNIQNDGTTSTMTVVITGPNGETEEISLDATDGFLSPTDHDYSGQSLSSLITDGKLSEYQEAVVNGLPLDIETVNAVILPDGSISIDGFVIPSTQPTEGDDITAAPVADMLNPITGEALPLALPQIGLPEDGSNKLSDFETSVPPAQTEFGQLLLESLRVQLSEVINPNGPLLSNAELADYDIIITNALPDGNNGVGLDIKVLDLAQNPPTEVTNLNSEDGLFTSTVTSSLITTGEDPEPVVFSEIEDGLSEYQRSVILESPAGSLVAEDGSTPVTRLSNGDIVLPDGLLVPFVDPNAVLETAPETTAETQSTQIATGTEDQNTITPLAIEDIDLAVASNQETGMGMAIGESLRLAIAAATGIEPENVDPSAYEVTISNIEVTPEGLAMDVVVIDPANPDTPIIDSVNSTDNRLVVTQNDETGNRFVSSENHDYSQKIFTDVEPALSDYQKSVLALMGVDATSQEASIIQLPNGAISVVGPAIANVVIPLVEPLNAEDNDQFVYDGVAYGIGAANGANNIDPKSYETGSDFAQELLESIKGDIAAKLGILVTDVTLEDFEIRVENIQLDETATPPSLEADVYITDYRDEVGTGPLAEPMNIRITDNKDSITAGRLNNQILEVVGRDNTVQSFATIDSLPSGLTEYQRGILSLLKLDQLETDSDDVLLKNSDGSITILGNEFMGSLVIPASSEETDVPSLGIDLGLDTEPLTLSLETDNSPLAAAIFEIMRGEIARIEGISVDDVVIEEYTFSVENIDYAVGAAGMSADIKVMKGLDVISDPGVETILVNFSEELPEDTEIIVNGPYIDSFLGNINAVLGNTNPLQNVNSSVQSYSELVSTMSEYQKGILELYQLDEGDKQLLVQNSDGSITVLGDEILGAFVIPVDASSEDQIDSFVLDIDTNLTALPPVNVDFPLGAALLDSLTAEIAMEEGVSVDQVEDNYKLSIDTTDYQLGSSTLTANIKVQDNLGNEITKLDGSVFQVQITSGQITSQQTVFGDIIDDADQSYIQPLGWDYNQQPLSDIIQYLSQYQINILEALGYNTLDLANLPNVGFYPDGSIYFDGVFIHPSQEDQDNATKVMATNSNADTGSDDGQQQESSGEEQPVFIVGPAPSDDLSFEVPVPTENQPLTPTEESETKIVDKGILDIVTTGLVLSDLFNSEFPDIQIANLQITVTGIQVTGQGEAEVTIRVFDPETLTEKDYSVVVSGGVVQSVNIA